MEKDNKYDYWIDLAEYDLITAEAMMATKRYLYVGFMCHQVIEKSLKALYIKINQKTPPYVHNLLLLSQESGLYDSLSVEQKDFLDFLQPLNIQTRYPAYKESILKLLDANKCDELIKTTRIFFEWIKNKQ